MIHVPVIQPTDYDAFQSILDDQIPETYTEWLKGYTEFKKELIANSQPARDVEVNPQEFERFCFSRKIPPNQKLLGEFATEKVLGKNY